MNTDAIIQLLVDCFIGKHLSIDVVVVSGEIIRCVARFSFAFLILQLCVLRLLWHKREKRFVWFAK